MDKSLTTEEREHLSAIARAAQLNEAFSSDQCLVASLIKKGMVRTRGDTIRLTLAGLEAARDLPGQNCA